MKLPPVAIFHLWTYTLIGLFIKAHESLSANESSQQVSCTKIPPLVYYFFLKHFSCVKMSAPVGAHISCVKTHMGNQ